MIRSKFILYLLVIFVLNSILNSPWMLLLVGPDSEGAAWEKTAGQSYTEGMWIHFQLDLDLDHWWCCG